MLEFNSVCRVVWLWYEIWNSARRGGAGGDPLLTGDSRMFDVLLAQTIGFCYHFPAHVLLAWNAQMHMLKTMENVVSAFLTSHSVLLTLQNSFFLAICRRRNRSENRLQVYGKLLKLKYFFFVSKTLKRKTRIG
jgi:hypothetical protein